MNPEKVGKFIKDLRKKNKLTQADLAKKYGVTYQAVSKWENGINLPEISLLREMSKDFGVNVEDILDGEISSENKVSNKKILLIPLIIILILLIILSVLINNNDSFEFKTISTTCKEFKVTGSVAYDSKKSSINISKINYCGGDDNTIYDTIECELYEEEREEKNMISKCNKTGKNEKLEDYLQEVEVMVDDYQHKCKDFSDSNLFLEIKASLDNKTVVYKVDLNLNNNCPN